MALTEAQQLTVCRILGVEPSVLEYQLTLLATDFTAERELAVETELTRWTTAGTKFVTFTATESNEGFNLSSEAEKRDIRRNIAILLEFDLASLGYGGSRIVRA